LFVFAGSACGRVGFDLAPGGGAPGDGAPGGDGGGGSNGPFADATIDALPALCANAIPAQLGVRALADTCAGQDLVDAACGTTNTREAVFRFVAPASGNYMFRTYDAGTTTVTMGTGQLDTTCAVVMGCPGLSTVTVAAGSVTYFVWEAGMGQCRPVEFLID
jgi:hypothetical protein